MNPDHFWKKGHEVSTTEKGFKTKWVYRIYSSCPRSQTALDHFPVHKQYVCRELLLESGWKAGGEIPISCARRCCRHMGLRAFQLPSHDWMLDVGVFEHFWKSHWVSVKMGLEPRSSFGNRICAFLHPLGIALPRRSINRKGHGPLQILQMGILPLHFIFCTTPPRYPALCCSGEWKMGTVWSETFLPLKAISSADWSICCPRDGRSVVS